MLEGFSISNLDVDVDFSFWGELGKFGFKCISKADSDAPTEYVGEIYDYESDEKAKVIIEKVEKSFRGVISKYIYVYKSINGRGKCVYVGLQPQSHLVFRILMANLFPSEYYINHYEDATLNREYERTFGNKSDIE